MIRIVGMVMCLLSVIFGVLIIIWGVTEFRELMGAIFVCIGAIGGLALLNENKK